MSHLNARDAKLVQYLNEAYGKERHLEQALEAHIGLTTKATYRKRSIHECINARFRQWGLVQLTVRGRAKATIVLTWYAVANNIFQGERLRRAAPAAI